MGVDISMRLWGFHAAGGETWKTIRRWRRILLSIHSTDLTYIAIMTDEPHTNNARATKGASKVVESNSDVPVGGIYFTPELIARVATFAEAVAQQRDGASDVKNICLAVGPVPSRIIKHVYLKKNMGYLEKVMYIFAAVRRQGGKAEWARECHLAWMSVNTGWRSLVTDELMERHENASNHPSVHPLLTMVNPAVAMEMGLLEALKHLVEIKDIDINAGWSYTTYFGRLSSFGSHGYERGQLRRISLSDVGGRD